VPARQPGRAFRRLCRDVVLSWRGAV